MSPLLIRTTGLHEYAPDGTAHVKVLMIGGPGVGKTRWASYFPRPIYADCEKGLASVADRTVPYLSIRTSDDMFALLQMLKQESNLPRDKRTYDTVVIDTLDAFQRKVKNEWMEKERKQVFTGWEAWGYLGSRMQMLMTRLLNLDLNVVVNCHYKDKITKDDETGRETHELMLQLQGETADTAFNDFDLVGWMGVYFEAVDGQRVQKRGVTFKPTPDKPFLKDRLHVTPPWLEVTFDESDYANLFDRIQARVSQMAEGEVVGEVPTDNLDGAGSAGGKVVAPGAAGSGPIPGTAERIEPVLSARVPYSQMDRPTLLKRVREAGITQTVDGAPIRGNVLKAELIAALEARDASTAAAATSPTTPAQPTAATGPRAATPPAQPVAEPEQAHREDETKRRELAQATAGQLANEPGSEAPRAALARRTAKQAPMPAPRVSPESGPGSETQPKDVSNLIVLPDLKPDEEQDERAEPTIDEAVATVEKQLGGTVIGDSASVDPPQSKPSAPAGAVRPITQEQTCEQCGKSLAEENPDFVKLSWIKYRQRLCQADYQSRKTGTR